MVLGLALLCGLLSMNGCFSQIAQGQDMLDAFREGRWRWRMSRPLISPVERPEDPCFSVKDPSVVFWQGAWHVFCTIRSAKRTHQIEYLSFADWSEANAATRHVLGMHPGYFCAPQVFFFEPQGCWYLICQASDKAWQPEYGAAYSTTNNIADPGSWTKLRPLGHRWADGKAGLDYWVICDEAKAHLFFTTLDGRMWREETSIEEFPSGWSEPFLVVQGDIFEAGHVYRLKGMGKFLAIVEAQNGHGWRYQKAYLADRLEGPWRPLAAERERAFASMANVIAPTPRWADCISHGELLRAGCNQFLEVDPSNLRFVFQGVLDSERVGKPYGQIPWRLGLLQPAQ